MHVSGFGMDFLVPSEANFNLKQTHSHHRLTIPIMVAATISGSESIVLRLRNIFVGVTQDETVVISVENLAAKFLQSPHMWGDWILTRFYVLKPPRVLP